MAAGSALKKINKRAKEICHSTGCPYRAAQKRAGAEYRAGNLGKVVRMHKKKRTGKKRTKVGRSTGVLYGSMGKGYTARAAMVSGRPHNGMIGAGGHSSDGGYMEKFRSTDIVGMNGINMGSVNAYVTRAKKIIEHNIGKLETQKFVAKKKSTKKKIAKRISEMKTKFRKLC